jgi:anti-anti-sigma regulatory factor
VVDSVHLAVAVHACARVVLVSGRLDRTTAPRVARLVGQQVALLGVGGHLVVDLSGVQVLDAGGAEALRHLHDAVRSASAHLHLSGVDDSRGRIPPRVARSWGNSCMHATRGAALQAIAQQIRSADG